MPGMCVHSCQNELSNDKLVSRDVAIFCGWYFVGWAEAAARPALVNGSQ